MKLMHHAGTEDPIFLRIGTSGGLGKHIIKFSLKLYKHLSNNLFQKLYLKIF